MSMIRAIRLTPTTIVAQTELAHLYKTIMHNIEEAGIFWVTTMINMLRGSHFDPGHAAPQGAISLVTYIRALSSANIMIYRIQKQNHRDKEELIADMILAIREHLCQHDTPTLVSAGTPSC